jgi:hypothetical protein
MDRHCDPSLYNTIAGPGDAVPGQPPGGPAGATGGTEGR